MLITSLPARNARDARRQAATAAAAGADVAEVRFDRWPSGATAKMQGLFPSPLPLLATLRSRAEGGDGPDDRTTRGAWIDRALRQPFGFVDVEAARDPLPTDLGDGGPRLVVSRHFTAPTDAADVAAAWERALPTGTIRKLVLPAAVGEVLERWMLTVPPRPGAYVLHTLGPSGPLLRAWSKRLGMAAVYAALPRTSPSTPTAVEASQLPVDRLRRWFDAGADAPIFAVVGRPVSHSRSPDIHHAWMEAARRAGLYVPLEFASEEELRRSIPSLASGGFRGLNVTHPFKSAAYALAPQRSETAERCGCANTLTLDREEILADNSDLPAMRRRLDELESEGRWDGRRALVIGAGGAARAALAALEDRGASAEVLARDGAQARELARAFHAQAVGASKAPPPPLAIHATPVGRGEGKLEVDLRGRLRRGGYLLDYVYAPDDRALARQARSVRAGYEDGTRLLVYSAAESYRAWWGDAPSDDELTRAVRMVGT